MPTYPICALCQLEVYPGSTVVALAFTAVIIIPAGFLFGLLRERMAAKISKKNP